MLINKQLSIYRVRLPLPFRLNHINAYAIKGSEGWSVIDTGLNTEPTRLMWQKFMTDHQITGSDIKGIYITHSHPDHFGAAGWLQQVTGAPVYISAKDAEALYRVWQETFREVAKEISESLIQNGMPPELTNHAVKDMESIKSMLVPSPELSILEPGKAIQLGDHQYLPILTPGHSEGHICYFNSEFGVLFSGDHLLAKITSNISVFPDGEPDPLKTYLQSLQANRSLPCKNVLPAHGPAFDNLEQRISELEAHHLARLKLMKDCAGSGATGYEICRQVFSQELDEHEVRFAMTETMAHLLHLVYKGELAVFELNGIKQFKKTR